MITKPGRLTLGIVLPSQSRQPADLDCETPVAIARRADKLGFSAIWVRDVPLTSDIYPDPIGHLDPWVLLGRRAKRSCGKLPDNMVEVVETKEKVS